MAADIRPSAPQQADMFAAVGESTMEAQALAELKGIASHNQRYKFFYLHGLQRAGGEAVRYSM